MNTTPLRLLALIWTLLALTSEGAVGDGRGFSERERIQGFRQSTVLAEPRGSDNLALEAAEAKEGMILRHRFPRFRNLRVLRLPEGEDVQQAIKRLEATGRYAYVEPDHLRYGHLSPNDTSFAQQWALNNTGQNGGTLSADIRAVSGWDLRSDAGTVIVGVMDTGIRLTHEDLKDNLWTKPGTNNIHGISATNNNGTTTNDPNDDMGHGTHVAGIIGATGNNSRGTSGVAWKTQLMALKFLTAENTGSVADSIACIDYAIANGVSVINASYGNDTYSRSEFAAIERARNAGIIFVASAGNDGELNDTNESFPANYSLDNIVSVAATTRTDALASFSNYGSGLVEIGAPGSEIYSTFNSSDNSYATLQGTSMASPHVTGAIALLKASYPNESYRQLINRLLRSTTKLSSLRGKIQTGGRLNLAQALSPATGNTPFNDNFADRAFVAGPNVRIRSNNTGSSAEPGEQSHASVLSTTTLWWTWTAPATSRVAFDTVGSSYDTALAIYTGSNLSTLEPVASNDNVSGSTTTSRVMINATGGTTYQIAVSGKLSASGYTALRIGTVPTNDDFAGAQLVTGESLSVDATLFGATSQPGEPRPISSAAGHSVWYKWGAPKSGAFALSAFATSIDTVAAVYTGSTLSNLNLVSAVNNPATNPANSDALVQFNATAGTTYYFLIDHAANDSDSPGGDFTLTLNDAAWEFPAYDEVTSSPAVASDGTVYFGAGSGADHDTQVYAISSTGTKKWSVTTGESGIIGASPAIGADGTVFIGGTDKILYALNPANGSQKWSFTAGTSISSTPAIGSNGTIYFRDDTKLYALSSAGALRWTFDLAGSTDGTYCSPAIGSDGTIYVGTNGGAFYAVKDNGGGSVSQKWKFTADGDIFTSPSIAADGTLYFATLNGKVYALTDNGSSASQKWSWTAPNNNSITSSIAIGTDGTLYFAGYDQKLHALTSGGSEKWAFTLGDEVRASSPAIGADGTIYVGCYDGKVYAVKSDGTLSRVFTTARTVRSSPVIAGTRLYFGSADAKLYAFDIGQAAATSPWPMFQQNPQHTARSAPIAFAITLQPQSRTLVVGSTLTLSVSAAGTGTLSYQWYRNGSLIPGATSATYSVASATLGDAGSYTVTVSNGSESVTSSAAVISILPMGTMPSGFANIATRAFCSTGSRVTIGGFVVSGGSPKRVLIRAVGPSLTAQGLGASEVLADPTINVYRGQSIIASNDNWGDNLNANEISSTAIQIGAKAFETSDTKSSALLLTLDAGVYSFIVNGAAGASGVVLLEVYDADGGINSKFVNIATRAYSTTGNGVAIGGFVIAGSVSKNILVRAVGPTLATQGLEASEVLSDPTIELHHGIPVIASNDDWGSGPNKDEIIAAGVRIGATPFALTDTRSSALLLNLPPGVYSFIARGKSDSSGIVLVEIYDAD